MAPNRKLKDSEDIRKIAGEYGGLLRVCNDEYKIL
jgi:hypothetical protein